MTWEELKTRLFDGAVIKCNMPEQTMNVMQYLINNGCHLQKDLQYHLDPSHPMFADSVFLNIRLPISGLEHDADLEIIPCRYDVLYSNQIEYEEIAHLFDDDISRIDSDELFAMLSEG